MILALRSASSFKNFANAAEVVPSGSVHSLMNCLRTSSFFMTLAISCWTFARMDGGVRAGASTPCQTVI